MKVFYYIIIIKFIYLFYLLLGIGVDQSKTL